MSEVTIVGGGPAGSVTGYTIMEEDPDKDVALFERAGSPRSVCGGAVGSWWLDEVGLELPKGVVINPISDVYLHSPNETAAIHGEDVPIEGDMGYLIDRGKFDRWLLHRAQRAGVDVRVNTNVTSRSRDGEWWQLDTDGGRVRSWMVVDASGASHHPENHVAYQEVIDLEMYGDYNSLDLQPGCVHLFFQPSLLPDGYVWIFCLQDGYAKVGTASAERNPKRILEYWKKRRGMFNCNVVESQGDVIGTGPPVYDGKERSLKVGDAANFTSPLHGGGIYTALRSGQVAGECIVSGDTGGYGRRCRQVFGGWLKRHARMQRVIAGYDDGRWDDLVAILDDFEVESDNVARELSRLMWYVFKRKPGLIPGSIIQAFKRKG